jgi:DNA-binding GntR family transcriptional regulator
MANIERSQEARKRKLLREHVYTGVKTAIISGDFQPGKRLIEERLAADMTTSRLRCGRPFKNLKKKV